ncbi:MAG TPA: hypothetical protein VF339_15120 [Gammaproteobacteria bacterium]
MTHAVPAEGAPPCARARRQRAALAAAVAALALAASSEAQENDARERPALDTFPSEQVEAGERPTLDPSLTEQVLIEGLDDAPDDVPGDEGLEEVVVRGRMTRLQLYREAGRATERFWAMLNDFLKEPEFEVRCYQEKPPSSTISRRVCRTRFQEDELARMSREALAGGDYDPTAALVAKQNEFVDKILFAVNTSPELNQAIRDLQALKQAIDEADDEPRRRRRRNDDE